MGAWLYVIGAVCEVGAGEVEGEGLVGMGMGIH